MLNRIVIFLIRKKLKLKKYQGFRFVGQKTDAIYFFTGREVLKDHDGTIRRSSVSLNWLLDDECEIIYLKEDEPCEP